ncbi:BadF/BadG/BcrA/BcrD ATPase family protein [Clostridium sardiniense]|uniref:BadF/BadG/BcrA/BcrD ATPase family protein n=1 Tax=Clostridium sardiniense TaxID=29369 RepID=UPI003D33D9F0
MYYLGVDGGGTKTRYILVDENLNIIKDVERGTIHIHQIGALNLRNELKSTLDIIISESNIRKNDIGHVFLGIPGYGESKSDKNIIDDIVGDIFNGINYTVGNDAVAGWAAGTGCNDGINIVSGTGSIAYGRNKEGIEARCGGWGPGIGDDGSAYWIALRVINEYTKQKDGRKEKTVLLDIMERELDIKDYFEVVDIVFNRLKFSRTEIASFARIASIAAKEGCRVCNFIFEEAAYNLFLHIRSLSTTLNLKDGFILSYTGGVFRSGGLILDPLKVMLDEDSINCIIKEPEIEPWHGAALMAYKLSGREVPKDYKERFKH